MPMSRSTYWRGTLALMWLFPAEADPGMAIFSNPPAHRKQHYNNGMPPLLPSFHLEESKRWRRDAEGREPNSPAIALWRGGSGRPTLMKRESGTDGCIAAGLKKPKASMLTLFDSHSVSAGWQALAEWRVAAASMRASRAGPSEPCAALSDGGRDARYMCAAGDSSRGNRTWPWPSLYSSSARLD